MDLLGRRQEATPHPETHELTSTEPSALDCVAAGRGVIHQPFSLVRHSIHALPLLPISEGLHLSGIPRRDLDKEAVRCVLTVGGLLGVLLCC